MEELFKEILWWEKVKELWSELAKELEKREVTFRVADFDYTLFSRDEQFKWIPELLENRADKWPLYLYEKYGMNSFIKEYYKDKKLPTEILSKLDSTQDIIMTAWGSKDFQIAKIRSCKQLDAFRAIVTQNGQDKVPELIRYVIFELRYIPSKIIIYEDRPQYFIQYRELIEWVLGCELTIMKVVMDGNDGYKKIEQD